MIVLKPCNTEDWKYIKKWTTSESESIQFAGQIFTFPIDKNQFEIYLSDSNRNVFKIINKDKLSIGIAEISIVKENLKDAKLARILMG